MNTDAIAVVGMACQFPGAENLDTFWDLLRSGRSGLRTFNDSELDERQVPASLRRSPGYIPVGGMIDGQDLFDPEAFGFTDAEAALLDPQFRLFLQISRNALEHAGHAKGDRSGTVGVFAGSAHSAYLAHNLADRWDSTGGSRDPLGSLQTSISTQADYLPLHVAYRLNLTGPAVGVQSTCSTSLVAVHMATQSLLTGECDTALAGGVSLIVPQGHGYLHVNGGIFSNDGTVRSFGADSSGIVYSQGVGAVVLRRLEDAQADGDPVLAVIGGSAVTNDGGTEKAGFTAPSVVGQATTIAQAQAIARIDPSQVGLVEAHGTGTPLGDPVEIEALQRVFGAGPPWCALGSVKSNIGHANTAAGIASLIKAVLACSEQTLPPTLHATVANPRLKLADSPFELVSTVRSWDTPPLAGVSSFGIGGTNCHIVLGPATDIRPKPPTPSSQPVFRLSGPSAHGVVATAKRLADWQTQVAPEPADVAYSLDAGRPAERFRAAVGELRSSVTPVDTLRPPSVVTVFSGAGSAFAGMGRELYDTELVFKHKLDETAELLSPHMKRDVRSLLDPDFDELFDVATMLPATYAVSLALHTLLSENGYHEHVMVGHSLGECTAAVAAGLLDPADGAILVAARCQIAAELAQGGAMLAVAANPDRIINLLADLDGVNLAVLNGTEACVISGERRDVETVAVRLRDETIATKTLPVGAAMHSPLVDPGIAMLEDRLSTLRPGDAWCPVASTVTGAVVTSEFTDASFWGRQLRQPVRFADAIQTATELVADDEEVRIVLTQIGPGNGLLAHARAASTIDADVTTVATLTSKDAGDTSQARADLWAAGVDVSPTTSGGRMINVPGYAFDRRRLWVDPPEAGLPASSADAHEPLHVPLWTELPWPDGALLSASGRDEDAARQVVEFDADAAADAIEWFATAEELSDDVTTLVLITRNGVLAPGDTGVSPAVATAAPLLRIRGQERPGLRWAIVDVDDQKISPGSLAERAVTWAFSRIDDTVAGRSPTSGLHLAVRGNRLLEQRLASWTPESLPTLERPRRTAVVIGGLGGVGQLITRVLVQRGHRVVVTTRSAKRANDLNDLSHEVEVVVCDATNANATSRLLDGLVTEGIDLVVHAAGAFAGVEPAPIRHVTPAMAAAQLTPKVEGVNALDAGLNALPATAQPHTVLVVSTVAVHVGGVGLGAYAASNAAMDALVASHQDSETGGPRWHSLQSDGWSLEASGPQETALLEGALDQPVGEAALHRILNLAENNQLPPVFALSTTNVEERSRKESFTEPDSGEAGHFTGTQAVVAEIWAALLGRPPTSETSDFFALDGHSLLAARMLTLLGERTGCHLGLRDLLANPTVAGLAEMIDQSTTPSLSERGAPELSLPPSERYLDTDGGFPMTRIQHAYWIGRSGGYEGGGTTCYFYLEYRSTNLDPDRLERAWNSVIERHVMLRVATNADGRFVELQNLPNYRIRVRDIRTSQNPEQRLDRLRARIRDASSPSDQWPLVQWQIVRTADDCWHVQVGVDVLVCDAASWWRIEADLYTAYQNPDQPLPPIATHPGVVTAASAYRRDGTEGQAARIYWNERLPLPSGPKVPQRTKEVPMNFRRHHVIVAADRYKRLQELAAEYRLTPTSVLLTIYTEALQKWGPDQFCITMTLFDRPAISEEITQLVGDFTTLLLHEATTAGSFLERAVATQQRVFEDLDHSAWGALDLLAASSPDEAEASPVVFTSALGVAEQMGEDRLEWLGEQVHAASRTPQTLVDHQVLEHRGELRLQWDVLDSQVDPDAIEDLVSRQHSRLNELIDNADSWTADDIGQVSLGDAAVPSIAEHPDPLKVEPNGGPLPSYQSIVVPLRYAGSSTAPTLHLVHPSGGDVVSYAELAQRIDADIHVLAVTDPELCEDAGPYPTSLPEMASTYIDALRQRGFDGPWLLGGWSMGGTIAQEMCRQLTVSGETVQLLIMIDSCVPDLITAVTGDGSEEALVSVRQLHALEAYLGLDLDVGPDAVQHLLTVPSDQLYSEVAERMRRHHLLGSGEQIQLRVRVLARHLAMLAQHRATPVSNGDFPTLLVRCSRRSPRNSGIGMGVDDASDLPDLGWSPHLPDRLHIVDVDAHHYGVFDSSALASVVHAVSSSLFDYMNS